MPTNFTILGIPKGATLVSVIDASITAEVVNENQIFYNGKNTSLSTAAIEILKAKGKNPQSARGTVLWKYNGKLISELSK